MREYARARPLTRPSARSPAPVRASARSRLYRYFCSGLSFLFGAPLLHPTIVYLKCHEGEGVHGHARVQCSERCWPTGCYGLYTGRVAKPLTYMSAYVCVYARIFARMHTHTHTHVCMYTYTRAPPFSAAVPISGGTASRCIREAHRSYTRDVDFQSPPHLRLSPFFFSLDRLPPFH